MNIQVRHDHHIEGSARFIEYVRQRIEQEFDRQSNQITHFEVHFSDDSAAKHGEHDKKCMIEARISGLKPAAVTCKGDSLELVLDGAIEKLHHWVEHHLAKTQSHRREMPALKDDDDGVALDEFDDTLYDLDDFSHAKTA